VTRPLLDVISGLDGCRLSLDGDVLTVGSLTHCARAQIAAYAALDNLDRVFRIQNLQAQRKEA
jgi:hypothetical protein